MPRAPRLVVPGLPHHVTQRGVRSLPVFFCEEDYELYLKLLRQFSDVYGVEHLAWCLMTNHVHSVAVPDHEDSLAKAFGMTHWHYTRAINFRLRTRGYLFQGRFRSCAMDETHTLYAIRYTELNPVQALMTPNAWEYRWSSARLHVGLTDIDPLVRDPTAHGLIDRWQEQLIPDEIMDQLIRTKTRTGKPCGSERFLKDLEQQTGRRLLPRKPGPKPCPKGDRHR